MASTQSSIDIPADPEQVMAVIADLESYPEWVEAVARVEVLTAGPDGRPETVRMGLHHKLLSDDYTVGYTWDDNRVSWKLIHGHTLTAMEGSYTIQPTGSGSRATYALTVDLKRPLPALVKRTAELAITDTALRGLKRQVARMSEAR